METVEAGLSSKRVVPRYAADGHQITAQRNPSPLTEHPRHWLSSQRAEESGTPVAGLHGRHGRPCRAGRSAFPWPTRLGSRPRSGRLAFEAPSARSLWRNPVPFGEYSRGVFRGHSFPSIAKPEQRHDATLVRVDRIVGPINQHGAGCFTQLGAG